MGLGHQSLDIAAGARFIGQEKRREQRFLIERPVQIIHRNWAVSGWLVDFSAHGIHVLSPRLLAGGEKFIIQLDSADAAAAGFGGGLRYQVRNWLQLWAEAYRIGADLQDSTDAVKALALFKSMTESEQ